MNFKKTWKRFFTVSRASEGFTLVELIVVIAILAILAGIAVPAYSGYIKKADKAAELQLLGAVNTAFAAAALENGEDVNEMPDGSVRFSTRTKNVTLYDTEFQKYFAGNTGDFKVIQYVYFQDGVFVENTEGSGSMSREQLQAAVGRYNGSNFAGNEEDLVGTVEAISGILADRIENNLDLASFMGGEEAYNDFLAQYGLTNESDPTEIGNALVMHTASQLSSISATDIAQDIGEIMSSNPENLEGALSEQLIADYGPIPAAALMYGLVTGYANSSEGEGFTVTTPNGLGDVWNMVGSMVADDGWSSYLANAGGALADTDGFLAAMQVINAHDNSFDLSQSDAFTNQNTMDLLNSILGTNQQQ